MSKSFLLTIVAACLLFSGAGVSAGTETRQRKAGVRTKLTIRVAPWGPTQANVDAAKRRVELSDAVQRELNGSRFRLMNFEYVYDSAEKKEQPANPPTRFRITYYNYSTDMTLLAESDFAGREKIKITSIYSVPGIGIDEMPAAQRLVEQDASFAAWKSSDAIEFYDPMPPTTVIDGERIVNVGIRNHQTGDNQIVGVSFKNGKVIKYPNNAPPTSAATPDACGVPNAGQAPTGQGIPGQFTLTVAEQAARRFWRCSSFARHLR